MNEVIAARVTGAQKHDLSHGDHYMGPDSPYCSCGFPIYLAGKGKAERAKGSGGANGENALARRLA